MADKPVEIRKSQVPSGSGQDPWQSLRTEMDRLFDRFATGFGGPALRRMFEMEPLRGMARSAGFAVPAVDVAETEAAYKITAELPGMKEEDIEVTMSGDTLTLRGEKRQEKEEKAKDYHLSERSYGAFQRAFALPEGVDRDKVAADFSNGVLTITLPKTAEAQKPEKRIEVKRGP